MKRILLASAALLGTAVSAQAADLAAKAPYLKAPVVAVYNWTGFYIGVNAGVGIGRDRTTHSLNNDSVYLSPQGAFGGAQSCPGSARFVAASAIRWARPCSTRPAVTHTAA